MADGSANSTGLRDCLDRLGRGDAAALNELIRLAGGRLEVLARRMMRDFPRVRRWAETGDVLQNSLVRLCRALGQVKPATPRDFYSLATTQIRRELIDLARHFAGAGNPAAHHESWAGGETGAGAAEAEKADLTHEPGGLADWGEFHQQVADLPDEQREVFGLLFYQGLSQDDAAAVLGVNVRTVQRRWQAALLHLHRARNGEPPGS